MKKLSSCSVTLIALTLALSARGTEITLPRETAALKDSTLPGFPLAQAPCC